MAARTAASSVVFVVALALGLHTDSPTIRAADGPRVLRESTANVEIQFTTPELQVRQVIYDDRAYHAIELEEFGTTGEPGMPAVPVQRRMVAVPPGATVNLQAEVAKPILLAGDIDPLPVPYGEPVLPADDPTGLPIGVTERYAADAVAYASDAWTPAEVVRIADQGTWRGIDFVTLQFAPVQFQPGQRAARYVPWAEVHLSFSSAQLEQIASPQEDKVPADRLSQMIDRLFLNADTARVWQRPAGGGLWAAGSGATQRSVAMAPTNPDRWLIEVETEGLHKLSYSDLDAASVPVSTMDPRNLHLVTGDGQTTVAMWIDGEVDGSFDGGDVLYFYAPDPASRWSANAFYWLTLETTPGTRMTTVQVPPDIGDPLVTEVWATHRSNPPTIYVEFAIENSDKWFDSVILPRGTKTLTFPSPPGFAATADVTLTLRLGPHTGIKPNPNYVSASLNGTPIASNVEWNYSAAIFEHPITVSSSLIQATNTLDVSTTKISYLDGVDVEYRRELMAQDNVLAFRHHPEGTQQFQVSGFTDAMVYAFDIADPTNPERLENGDLDGGTFAFSSSAPLDTEYFLTGTSAIRTPVAITQEPVSSLWDTSHDVDYLVVSHPDFISALGPLLTHREGQGLTTLVADLTDVYKEFGDGTPNPEGIHNFVYYAYHNWATRPAYLLLVGDGHFDVRNYLGTDAPNPMPPYLADKDPYIGETTVDYYFSLVDGSDEVGDLLVGRFSVNDASETTAIVDKIIDYETSPPAGDWHRRGLFVTDNPDAAGDFHAVSDAVIDDLMPYDMHAVRAYQGAGNPPLSNEDVRDVIIDTLNTTVDTDGALFMQYVGHGSQSQLAFPLIWNTNNISSLTNDVYPLSLTWTCWDNYFIRPESTKAALAEEMVRTPNKGSIATFGPTGLDTVASHDVLTRGFFDAWFNDGVNELGQAVLNAKVHLFENGPSWYHQLLYTFMLHGDPALRLPCELYGDLSGDNTVNAADLGLADDDWADPVDPLGNNVTVEHLTRIAAQYGATCTVPEP